MKGPAWYTADRSELVPDGDPRSAFLAAGPGDEVPTDVPWAADESSPDGEKPVASAAPKKRATKRTAKPAVAD